MYDDVLIATDGSEVAATASSVGITLARHLEATVHVLSVHDDNSGADSTGRKRCEDAVESVAADADAAGCEIESAVRTGRPSGEILAYADEANTDVIVVGTHGRTGLKQALLGSVALEVIREAPDPVLTVGTATGVDASETIEDVCLATDGSTGTAAATEHALSLADACDATLHTVYAVDIDHNTPELRENFFKHGEKTTEGVEDRASERGLETVRTVTDGPAHEVILEYVETADIDVLVMGTESKSNLERLVFGSVSQRVVPEASAPVMTVRTADR